jgi:hypothetical protein
LEYKKGNLNRKYLNHFGTPLFSLFLPGCTPASLLPNPWTLASPFVLALLAILGMIALKKSGKIPTVKDLLPDPRFNEENITHTFIAALPTLTREMNLEVASSKQTEVLERSNARRLLGLDLGTNHAWMTVPVTYRYHLWLYDTWKLHVGGGTLIVCAPEIRCSLPPAIHTDEIQESTARGWPRQRRRWEGVSEESPPDRAGKESAFGRALFLGVMGDGLMPGGVWSQQRRWRAGVRSPSAFATSCVEGRVWSRLPLELSFP